MLGTKQQTINKSFTLKGKGLHTGEEVTISFNPAPVDYGYRFVRTDMEGMPEIPALADYVTDIARSTILEKDGAKLQTIEHVLSALYGCEVDNCKIEIDGQEPPILDGSAKPFVEKILEVGLVEQEGERKCFVVDKPMTVKDETTGSEVTLLPDTTFRVDAHIAFDNSPFLTNQYAQLASIKDYAKEISHCRTFVFFRELEVLLQNNLVKGGDLNNAIVIMDKEVPQEEIDRLADLFGQNTKIINDIGVISNEPLRYKNEPARHKLLDIVGDLALCGRFIKGRVIATRPGHKINTDMAKEIRKRMIRNPLPVIDLAQEPILDTNEIRKLLPHRYPFLLVDKVMKLSKNAIVGVKNVTSGEGFFVGHFPDEPVMPGVLIVEAMAQCGGIMVLQNVDEPEKYSTYFAKIDEVRFRRKVVPGDTLVLYLEMIAPLRRGMVYMNGKAYVGDTLVAEGNLMAQVIKNK